jgi:NhaP-type Na+/H+ or K+/H+ antiporter
VITSSAAHTFEVDALVLGGVLMLGALLSGIARRSFLSLTAVFALLGFALGKGAAHVVDFNPRSGFVQDLAIVALIVILFRDGLEVDAEMLQREWHLPLRKLVLAMPITCVVVAAGARLLTNLSWAECFLLGALLSPTDPVLSSAVVTNPRVPRLIRHSLNLESGLNDGLALPAVLAFAAALGASGPHFVWWKFVLQNVLVGLATGLVVGLVASVLMPRDQGLGRGIPGVQKALYALGTALATYGITELPPHGNGLIAVYVAAITLGVRRPDIRSFFVQQAADIVEIVKVAAFLVFGSLLTIEGLFADGWAAVGIVAIALLVARPVGVFTALVRTATDLPERAFMSWFGPKGVSTISFSLLVLTLRVTAGVRIFNLAALAVLCSVIAHGLTDTPGAEWIGRHADKAAEREPEPAGAAATQ